MNRKILGRALMFERFQRDLINYLQLLLAGVDLLDAAYNRQRRCASDDIACSAHRSTRTDAQTPPDGLVLGINRESPST
jgi:hypothetical protein